MSIMTLAGYVAAITIGISLGLIGGGGSILTVPTLVYLMSINPVLATSYSLFVVGTTALAGSFAYMKKGLVSYRTVLIFGTPSVVSVFMTRHYLVPTIPEVLFTIDEFTLTKEIFIMALFAVLMVFASFSMIRKRANGKETVELPAHEQHFNYPLIFLEGLVVGAVTGLVGAGGGFLIIPALVLLAELPIKMAVGTSLLIIATNSLIGFTGNIGHQPIDWMFILGFTSLAVAGIFIGSYLSHFVSSAKLKPAFGWFVLTMGLYILVRELLV